MIGKVSRGAEMGGLLAYLAGPGRSNEHTEAHLVAGNAGLMTMWGGDDLDRSAGREIAAVLGAPRIAFGVEVTRSLSYEDPSSGERVEAQVPGSVWHCSLSLAADEGQLTDDRWAAIAEDFVHRMGFAGDTARADCRWVAVRHGLSTAGNDHVHVAVSLVREDGTKASVHNDFRRVVETMRELERAHGLRELVPAGERDYPQRAETRQAREASARRGGLEVDAKTLERAVRAAAAGARDEVEFVGRLRGEGLLVHPRYATGRDDVVAGYSVALTPREGERPVWHGGGKLARDLTLPELRKGWPDRPETATFAVVAWRPLHRGGDRPQVQVRRDGQQVTVGQCVADLRAMQAYLGTVRIADRGAWAHAARDMAAVCAGWSSRLEAQPGPLADAARLLAKSAQLRAHETRARPAAMPSLVNTVALVSAQADPAQRAAADLLLLRQLAVTAKSISRAAAAAGDRRRAGQLDGQLRARLRAAHDALQVTATRAAVPQVTAEQRAVFAEAQFTFGYTGPLPSPLTPPAQPARSSSHGARGAGQESSREAPGHER